jgi:hypothetical protein
MRSPTPGRRGRLCASCGDAGAVATLAVMAAPTEVEIEANGLRFDTLLAGPEDGEAVILLHGYPQSAASRRETMEWLAGRGYRARRKRSDRNAGRRRSSSAGCLVTSWYPVTPASEACHDARCVERESAVGKPADFVNGPSSHAALRPRLTTDLLSRLLRLTDRRCGFTRPSPGRRIGVTRPSVLRPYARVVRSAVGGIRAAPLPSHTLPDQTLPGWSYRCRHRAAENAFTIERACFRGAHEVIIGELDVAIL